MSSFEKRSNGVYTILTYALTKKSKEAKIKSETNKIKEK